MSTSSYGGNGSMGNAPSPAAGGAGGTFGVNGGSGGDDGSFYPGAGGGGGAGANGGNGGSDTGNRGGPGGAGGVGGASGTLQTPITSNGTDAISFDNYDGGGGGGGGNGVLITTGSAVNIGSSLLGGNGGDGGSDGTAGGGGSGGFGLAITDVAAVIMTASNVTGGNGGAGGDGTYIGGAAGGGDGGSGGGGVYLSVIGSDLYVLSGSITGGQGGVGGGSGGNPYDTPAGGDGGAGVEADASATINVAGGSTVAGGAGASSHEDAHAGQGGVGISGANLTVINAGAIKGGMSGDTMPIQADAVDYTGGANYLDLNDGSLLGDIGVDGTGTTLTINQAGAASLASAITGIGSVTYDDANALILTGDSTYTGSTTITAGTLQLGNGGTSGSIAGTSGIADNAVLAVDRSDVFSIGTVISGAGTLKQLGTGTLDLTAANTYTGGTSLNAGTLDLGTSTSLGSGALAMAAGTKLGFTAADLDIANAISISGAPTIDVEPANSPEVLSGVISNGSAAGILEKIGSGTLVLTAANTYSGGTSLNVGTLELGAQTSAGTGAITFGGTTETLQLDSTGTLGASVAGFAVGDKIDLAALNASGAKASYAGGVLTVTSGASSDALTIHAAPAGDQYTVSSDANGHALISLTGSAVPPPSPAITITGTHATADTGEAPVALFSGVSVTDTDTNPMDSLQIRLSGAGGTLAGAGLIVGTDGSYSLAATDPDTLSRELDGLTFTPTNGTPGGKATTEFTLVAVSNSGISTYDTATSVVDTAVPTLTATATDGADYLIGTNGPDQIVALMGNDSVVGQAGNDSIYGGRGADTVLGDQGADLLLGNRGDDVLYGGVGADTLYGGKGNDVLYGGKGDDLLLGDLGNDTFAFNPGDTDFKSGISTGDTIGDFTTGQDKIDFTQGPAGTTANFGSTTTTATDFASIQQAAQFLINGGDTYAFVADGVDGFLFTTGGSGTAIADAVKLAGAGSATSLKYTDIAHQMVA